MPARERAGRSHALRPAARGNRRARRLVHSPRAGRGDANRRRRHERARRHGLCCHTATDDGPKPGPLTSTLIACGRDDRYVRSFNHDPQGAGSLPVPGRRLFRHDFRTAVPGPCLLRRHNLRRRSARSDRRRHRRLGSRRGRRRRNSRSNGRRWGRRRFRRRARPCGKKGQRVDVALVAPGQSNAEVDEGLGELGRAARADGADRGAFGDRLATLHGHRPQMLQRRGVTVTRLDGDGLAPTRHGPGERHDAVDRSDDWRSRRSADIDAAVLSGRVRMRRVERERAQHRAVDRPRPGQCPWHRTYQCDEEQDSQSPHDLPPLLPVL